MNAILLICFAFALGSAFYCFHTIMKSRFKTDAKKRVALLRAEYYAQQNRTTEKDEAFECEVKKIEIKYGLVKERKE